MADAIAIWGAVTGTAGLGITAFREIRGAKKHIRVDHGWHFVYETDESGTRDEMVDVWFYVMVHNTGRRPVHIEHVGFNFIVDAPPDIAEQVAGFPGVELPEGDPKKMEMRFEISLGGETFEAIPDGPSVKILTRGKPILGTGIDPFSTPVSPFAVSVPERYWWGNYGPLLPRLPPGVPVEESREAVEQISEAAKLELTVPRFDEKPGVLRPLNRLVPEGDVDRLTEYSSADAMKQDGP